MRASIVATLLALAAYQAHGISQSPAPASSQPTFRAGATVVEVSAIVTRDGRPVADLRADEVTVLDNGVRGQQAVSKSMIPGEQAFASRSAMERLANVARELRSDAERRSILFISEGHPMSTSTVSSWADDVHGSLAVLALNTGGIQTRWTNDLTADLDRLIADSRHYYRIAYAQPDPPAGKRQPSTRSITVRVERQGVDVRARKRYAPVSSKTS